MDNPLTTSKTNTSAFFVQSGIAFGVSLLAVMIAILYLPAEHNPWKEVS